MEHGGGWELHDKTDRGVGDEGGGDCGGTVGEAHTPTLVLNQVANPSSCDVTPMVFFPRL